MSQSTLRVREASQGWMFGESRVGRQEETHLPWIPPASFFSFFFLSSFSIDPFCLERKGKTRNILSPGHHPSPPAFCRWVGKTEEKIIIGDDLKKKNPIMKVRGACFEISQHFYSEEAAAAGYPNPMLRSCCDTVLLIESRIFRSW